MSNDRDVTGKYQHPPSDGGIKQCVRCGEPFGGERASMEVNMTSGPAYHADRGTEYDVVIDSPPGEPLACPECWRELDRERKQEANASLGDYA